MSEAAEIKKAFDINFTLNYIDVEDVAAGMIAAAEKGISGQKHIVGNKSLVNTSKLFEIANSLFPEVKIPPVIPRSLKTGSKPQYFLHIFISVLNDIVNEEPLSAELLHSIVPFSCLTTKMYRIYRPRPTEPALLFEV